MEKTLIIYAHPSREGFCGTYLSVVTECLQSKNVDFDVIDLYTIGYDPVLKKEEHYTSGGYDVSDQNKDFQKMITDAKNLIFIYPTWWQGMPAMLKGFFDRVFVPRFAFEYKGNMPSGLLKSHRAVVFTTSAGPRIFTRLIAGDRAMKNITRDILCFCGVKVRGVALGSARKLDDKKTREIQKNVQKALNFLQ